MPEALRRRKALASTARVPAPLSSVFPEESPTRAPPLRRTRPSAQRKSYAQEDEWNFFDSPRTSADISLVAPCPNIDFPARPSVGQHWEYAAANGLLRPSSEGRPSRVPCHKCEERVLQKDFFSGEMHYPCVRSISKSSQLTAEELVPPVDSDVDDSRLRPSEGGYECDHPGCSYHCNFNLKREYGECVEELDGDLTSSDAKNMSLRLPYSTMAMLGPEDTGGDITAAQAKRGVDIQGIPWENLPFSRADYRATRLRGENAEEEEANARPTMGTKAPYRANYYSFMTNTRRVKCSIVHFQLRNLCWATSKHDVYVMNDMTVVHWDAAARRKSVILDLTGSASSAGEHLPMVQISTMIVKNNIVVAGGFYGELVVKNLGTGTVMHKTRVSYDENSITNSIDLFDNHVMTSNNDCYVRVFDLATWKRKSQFHFATPVNHATRQPGGKIVCAVGDDNFVRMLDGDSGERITELHGHEDFSFATAWHPDTRTFATGSQDRTCRIWDVRNMSQSLRIMPVQSSEVRSVRFASSGRYLAVAEQKDFLYVYDVKGGTYDTCQEIDMFGELAGISFTPGGHSIFIAVSDRAYSSLLEYELNSSNYALGNLP